MAKVTTPWDRTEAIDQLAQGLHRLIEAAVNEVISKAAPRQIEILTELQTMRLDQATDLETRKEEVAETQHEIGLMASAALVEQAQGGQHAARIGEMLMRIDLLERTVTALANRGRAREQATNEES